MSKERKYIEKVIRKQIKNDDNNIKPVLDERHKYGAEN